MRFWWVNHKQTSRQEIGQGYLWSPKREANGARSQFYDNMRLARAGDFVLSFYDGSIRHIGVVQDFASPAFKPDEFGSTGENWSNDGWLLPVLWRPLANPIRPKNYISELGPLLPSKYSPIHPISGNGNQKAYLAEVSKAVFNFLVGSEFSSINEGDDNANLTQPIQHFDDLAEKRLSEDSTLDSTTRRQLVLARHGQGLFRTRVSEMERACRLTGIVNPSLLVASHIKPWRVCATAGERLDGSNGLLLTPHVDRLFDRGFISFEASGHVIVSPKLDIEDLSRLGLQEACARNCGPFTVRQAEYLAFHRQSVLLP